jgi:hypothetical protein
LYIKTCHLLSFSLSHFSSVYVFILSSDPNKDSKIQQTPLVGKYGTYTAVNGQIRAVYAPYCYRNPGRWFTTVRNENTVCIRPYTAQNAVLYTVPIYGDQDYGEIRPVFVPYLIVNGEVTTKNTVIRNHRPGSFSFLPILFISSKLFYFSSRVVFESITKYIRFLVLN